MAAIGWKPTHFLISPATTKAFLQPAGLANVKGTLSTTAFKSPSDPRWKNDQALKDHYAFMKEYVPEVKPDEDIAVLATRMSTDAPSAGLEEPEDVWTVERVQAGVERDKLSPRTRLETVVEHVPTGRLVAFTVLSVPVQLERSVDQYATLVLKEHRGHRLGMLLKIANLAFVHEAFPGHHYQFSLQRENEQLPMFRRLLGYSAYGEGWALYCESLGRELGLYQDPYQYFGMLSAEMHRAIRLVVDTGLHAKGWTREQAIQYSLENEAMSEAGIVAEIERYMAIPGQALSYKIGQLKILELRARAEKALGSRFDVREFHTRILESGCVPLKILEQKMDRWIGSKRRTVAR
jgi:hypothetical protein